MEPWDGPAGLVFTDGRVVGAALDRNGLRPLRVAVRDDGLVVCSSEAGTVDFLGGRRVRRGMLGPGEMLAVDPLGAGVETNAQIKSRLASRRPYGRWLKRHLEHAGLGDPVAAPSEDVTPRQVAAGYTRRACGGAAPGGGERTRTRLVHGRRHGPSSTGRTRGRSSPTSASASPRLRTPRSTTCGSGASCHSGLCSARGRRS